MENISKSVKKKDHDIKINGSALYVDDQRIENMLQGRFLRSTKAKAKIVDIVLPELPEGYFVVDKRDVKGLNRVHIVQEDMPVFAEETVEYIGEPILMVVGENLKEVERILRETVVVYEEMVPILDMEKSDSVFTNYSFKKGDIDKALQEADQIFIETFQTGHQEHAYLETQGMIAYPKEGGIVLRGSMQCPYYINTAVAKALGYEEKDVQVVQDTTGGGFGGKEDFPSILACQVAVAAQKGNRPVKVVFDRREDMEFSSKRHPSLCKYKAAVKDGRVTGMEIDVLYNGGAYLTLSGIVLARGVTCANGVYDISNLRVSGRAVKTNTVQCGAYRGFGGPQVFFAVEMMMNHIAKKLGVNPIEFKQRHLVKLGDSNSTNGKFHFHVPLPEMIERADELSNYQEKYEQYKNQTGRYRKGIGMSLAYHGTGFATSLDKGYVKPVVKIKKYKDNTVEILASTTEMGQGLKTTFSKIVGQTLGIPYDQIIIENPDTDRVPNSGPSVASRSLITVGAMVQRAAERLKKEWKDGEEQIIEENFVESEYMISYKPEEFYGDPYPAYAWSVNVVEIEIDTLTAETKVLGAWGVFDVGVPIDLNIIHGQVQGGMLQGIGYASMEQMNYDDKGRIRNNSFSDYIIPTAVDVPNLVTDIINNPDAAGPFGAKGAGELPAVGAAPAYVAAVENALGAFISKAPFTAEDIMEVLQEVHK